MSNNLARWAQPSNGLMKSREEREHGKVMQAIVFDAQETALEIEATKALGVKIMDGISELDSYRVIKANGDPMLNSLLLRVELQVAAKADGWLSNQSSGLL